MASNRNQIIENIHAEEDTESDYSLDYEYIGPRAPNYRNDEDADSDCSELSDSPCHNGFDMWDEDPYSTNDFTWESNDMKLTKFIKNRRKEINLSTPWNKSSFYKKEKGWPRQLPYSCSTTNHDQSASSLCMVLSDYGIKEKLHAIYRDRIIECGNPLNKNTDHQHKRNMKNQNTTWLEQDSSHNTHCKSSSSSTSSLFYETHASVSLSPSTHQPMHSKDSVDNLHFFPYTKYIKRSQFPITCSKDAYLSLSFEPLCLAEKYGYMAIGGLEGEFEVYCCMDQSPIKIWGTKFKGKNDVMLMTNAIQIVRLQHDQLYKHLLIACMNDAGVLIYQLPNHSDSHSNVILLHHIRAFDRVPINDAKLSSDGQNLVCVGDEACIFHLKLGYSNKQFTVTNPKKILIPSSILCSLSSPYSSQHLSWSKSSLYFAHTSDTHNFVLVWRTYPTLQMMYRIDSGGYAYAIEFHPQYETILAFTNRYGYLHTVDLSEAVSIHNPEQIVSVDKSSHTYNPSCPTTQTDEPIYHTMDLVARQEITMVSFRGQVNRKLRILAKINGIQWSIDGKYLYVSTKKRILAYRFMKSFNHVDTLEQMACRKTRAIMENYAKRKRLDDLGAKKKQKWNEKWNQIPEFIKEKAIADTHHLASH